MSDLVEAVHFAVSNVACIHTGEAVNGKCPECAKITRAAIRAVLAHFAEAGNVSDGMATAAHTCMGNTYDDIAAAMAAALKELEL